MIILDILWINLIKFFQSNDKLGMFILHGSHAMKSCYFYPITTWLELIFEEMKINCEGLSYVLQSTALTSFCMSEQTKQEQHIASNSSTWIFMISSLCLPKNNKLLPRKTWSASLCLGKIKFVHHAKVSYVS